MKSANPSIAQSRPAVNSPLSKWEISKLRGQARERAAYDGDLSPGCGNVYTALDAWGQSSGITPVLTEAQIAERVSRSERSVHSWIQELIAHGYIERRRVHWGQEYTVRWAAPAQVSAPSIPAKFAETEKPFLQTLHPIPANFAETRLQDTPSLTPKHSKSSKGGRVNTESSPLPEKRPPARSSPRVEELGEGLRTLGYQPDRPLLEILVKFVPDGCPIAASVATVRRRITRPHSKPLKQCMLPVFFREDVPAKWEAEAAILESCNAEQARVAEVDRKQEAADRIEAQGILERGETDPIERDWAIAILEMQGVGWAATA